MSVRKLAACVFLAALGAAPRTHAQAAPESSTATSAPLALSLELGNSKLDPEAVRKAIELELERPVTLAPETKTGQGLSVVVRANHTATVSYRAANGEVRTRSIGMPQDPAHSAEVIALLSGNLSRDEAAELLAALAAKAEPAPNADGAPSVDAAANPDATKPEPPKPEAATKTDAPEAATKSPPPSPKPAAQSNPHKLQTTPFPAFNLSLFAPVALYPHAEKRMFTGELGFVFSHVGELHGVGINVFALHTEYDLRGVSYATFYNRTGGHAQGVTAAALVNRAGSVTGVELSGIVNLSSGQMQGISLAGIASLDGDVQGLQASGIINRARRVDGMQAAGIVNVADEITGLQLGVVNVAGNVHGLQLGVVNVAKHVDGTSIGLVSVADNGRLQPVLWASSLMPLNAAMKFTVGPLYTQVGMGYAPGNDTYTYELGLGGHFEVGPFFVEPGIHYSEMRGAKHPFDHELLEHGHYRVLGGLRLDRVSPFVGGGVLHRFGHSADAPASDPVTVEGFAGVAFF